MAELHANLAEAAAYLREEADYNRSWTDGRRGGDIDWPNRKAYVSRRLELATERDQWADAIQKAIELLDIPPIDSGPTPADASEASA